MTSSVSLLIIFNRRTRKAFSNLRTDLVVHGVQLGGDVAGDEGRHNSRQVRLLDEQILQSSPLPVEVATA